MNLIMNTDLLIKIIIMGLAISVVIGSHFIYKGKKDAQVERIAQEVIDAETGLNINLEPKKDK